MIRKEKKMLEINKKEKKKYSPEREMRNLDFCLD
jgi:hypothetical protein